MTTIEFIKSFENTSSPRRSAGIQRGIKFEQEDLGRIEAVAEALGTNVSALVRAAAIRLVQELEPSLRREPTLR